MDGCKLHAQVGRWGQPGPASVVVAAAPASPQAMQATMDSDRSHQPHTRAAVVVSPSTARSNNTHSSNATVASGPLF